jgi:hypothetical protein
LYYALRVSAYRDDREALRDQLENLRREVANLRGETPETAADERLDLLAARVDRALEQVARDRQVLRELADGIAALRKGESPAQRRNRQGPRYWLFPVGAALGLGAFFVLRLPATRPPAPAPPAAVHGDYPGAPHAIEPLDFFDRAARLAEGKVLAEMRFQYVASSGTVDLEAPEHRGALHFRFASPNPPIASSTVDVTSSGVYVSHDGSAVPAFNQPVGKPGCTPAKVWAAAREAGAPQDALATLTYHRRVSEKRPVWEFEIEGTRHSFVIGDAECRVLTPDELSSK